MTDKLNLVETIARNSTFSIFSRLMDSSGANAVFTGDGNFTVFAPTNDAFGKISDKRMNELLNEPDQTSLKALLSYHILPEKLFVANLSSRNSTATITGAHIAITDSNGLKVNDSGVQARNIEATNGIVHALDTVLNNDNKKLTTGPLSPLPEAAEVQPQLAGLTTPAPETESLAATAVVK
ncbi:MAG TPA: fasciclin domain-containing protein [Pyrinomonadaceae bacterium]|nr:fasciclin domain-containing protein [Pyrinomonadaceae bacterium]